MKTRSLLITVFLLTMSSCNSCQQDMKPKVTTLPADVAMTTGGNYDAEISAVAIPPNGKCGNGTKLPNGRIIASTGGGFRLLLRDLLGGGGQKSLSVFNDMPGLENGEIAWNDNQLARLNNGDLLLVWMGNTWEDITDANGAHPAWWNVTSKPGLRRAFHIWRSTDCGDTWTYDAMIDAAKVKVADEAIDPGHQNDVGRCGWPEGGPDANGKYAPGGWDRHEVYADPFDGTVYLSTTCSGGGAAFPLPQLKCDPGGLGVSCSVVTEDVPIFPGHAYSQGLILALKEPSGKDWSDSVWLKPPLPAGPPTPMTSTGSGNLFAYQSQYDQPTLRRQSKPDGSYDSVVAHSLIDAEKLQDCYAIPGDILPAGDPNRNKDFLVGDPWILVENTSISRVYRNPASGIQVVRIAYPATEGYEQKDGKTTAGRQVYMVTIVLVKSDGSMVALATHAIRAKDPKGSVLQGTFVETDRTELTADEDAALFYWVEEVPGNIPEGKLIVRGQVVRDSLNWSDTFDLSGEWTPSFDAAGHNGWRGDYLHGAFYFADGTLNFLAQWPQTDESLKNDDGTITPNLNIHYNIVTVGSPTPPSFLQKLIGSFSPARRDLAGSERSLPPPTAPKPTHELTHGLELELMKQSRRGTPTPTPRTPLTAPKASATDFYYGGASCGGTELTVYVGVLPEDVRRVELHYLLQDARGEKTPEMVQPMSQTGGDHRVYARAIHATDEELPPGYTRMQDARLLYYVVITDSNGVTTRGEVYGEQQPDTAVKLVQCVGKE